MPDGPQVLHPGLFEVRQIRRVMDDAHGVGLREAGAQPVDEVVVGRVPRGLQGLTGHGPTRYSPVGTTSPPAAATPPVPLGLAPGRLRRTAGRATRSHPENASRPCG